MILHRNWKVNSLVESDSNAFQVLCFLFHLRRDKHHPLCLFEDHELFVANLGHDLAKNRLKVIASRHDHGCSLIPPVMCVSVSSLTGKVENCVVQHSSYLHALLRGQIYLDVIPQKLNLIAESRLLEHDASFPQKFESGSE